MADEQNAGQNLGSGDDGLTPALRRELEELRRESDARKAELVQSQARLAEQEAAVAQLNAQIAAAQAEREQAQQAVLGEHRRALLAEHRGSVIEDLVAGESIEALDASVERAREAHARIAEQVRQAAAAGIPAGNPARSEPNVEGLSPQAKIAEALRRQR